MLKPNVPPSRPGSNGTVQKTPPLRAACINMKERFGDRFKVQHEESYYAERGVDAWAEDPWLMILPCQHGEICPWGGEKLAACTFKAGPIAKRLKALPFTTVAQDGDDGANVVFPVSQFEAVAEIMRPRKRRRGRLLSPEERELLVQAGEKYRFSTGRQTPGAAPEATFAPRCDSEPVWDANGAHSASGELVLS